ncbi:MAG: GTP-binding protein [Candidatus Lokiarchaeota archaeon]|nr:GTP-binding protein [Candidatus Lokiarchaeota archaeon]
MNVPERNVRFKLVLFGNASVGKTSLVERFVNDRFDSNYMSTLGYNVYEKKIAYKNALISLMIYDIGGQEQFRELRRKYAEGAHTGIIVYDITDLRSFETVSDWKFNLYEFAGEIPFIIIGNKVDLEHNRKVNKDMASNLAVELDAVEFFETSAKNGDFVQNAFTKLAAKTYDKFVEQDT